MPTAEHWVPLSDNPDPATLESTAALAKVARYRRVVNATTIRRSSKEYRGPAGARTHACGNWSRAPPYSRCLRLAIV